MAEATIDQLQIEIQASSNNAASGLDSLTASLTNLRTAVKGGIGLTTATKQFQAFSQSILSMQAPGQKVAELVASLKPLETIGKSNLGSALSQLKSIPQITKALSSKELQKFGLQIQLVTKYIQPLATEMEKVSLGFSRLPANIQKAINANAKLTTSNKSTAFGFNMLAAKISIIFMAVRRVANVIGDWIQESNDYVENLNLFTVAMGDYAESAQAYAESVGEIMGIDPSAWMRSQGIFMTLATGFGVAADKAALMSKNLTQLGYDLSSFFNISVEDAMQKLQSGLAGELEPLRRLGYDLSQARLEQIALSLGIRKSVADMNQAEKSQLRYYAILTQVTTAQGDMARTLEAPANQLRILKAQATQAARALGNVFIPALNAVLPYAIAFLKVIRTVANEIANLFGFALPEVDYSSLDTITTSAEEADEAVTELKNSLLGFDELNILNTSANGLLSTSGDALDITLPDYDFLGDLIESKTELLADKLEEPLKNALVIVGEIGAVMLGWKIATSVIDTIANINKLGMGGAAKLTFGIALVITGYTLEYQAIEAIANGTAGVWDYIKGIMGIIAGTIGGHVLLGLAGVSGPMGWAIAIGVTMLVTIVEWQIASDKALSSAVEEGFYDIETGITISNLAIKFENVTTTITSGLQDVITASEEIDTLKTSIENVNAEIELIDDAWAAGVLPSADYVDQLILLIGQLETDTADILTRVKNNIIEATSGAFGIALVDSGVNVEEFKIKVTATVDSALGNLENLTNEYSNLAEDVRLGTISQADAEPQLASLKEQILALSNTSLTSAAEFGKLSSEIGNIDWEDSTAVTAFFASITESSDTAMQDIEGYYGTLQEQILMLQSTETTQAGKDYWQRILDTIPDAIENAKAPVKQQLEELNTLIQDDLIAKMPDMLNQAQEEWDNLGFFQKAMYGWNDEKYIQEYISKYTNETIPELTDQMKDMLDDYGIDVSNYASSTVDDIMKTLFGGSNNDGLLATIGMTDKLSSETLAQLDALGIDIRQWAADNGIEIEGTMDTTKITMATESAAESTAIDGQAMLGSITLSNTNAWGAIELLWGAAGDWFKDKVTAPLSASFDLTNKSIGKAFTDTLAGIKTGWISVATWFSTNVTQPINNFFADSINGVIDVLNYLIRSLNNIKIKLPDWDILGDLAGMEFGFNVQEIQKKTSWSKYGTYADGGFPTSGDLFFANENGIPPEMVGTIGGRTAVANNDQIVAGIASGVASANETQNTLLRRLIALQERALEQGSVVVFAPSAEAGRVINKSQALYDKARGIA